METGRMFGFCADLSACMTLRCLETSRILFFRPVSAQSLVRCDGVRRACLRAGKYEPMWQKPRSVGSEKEDQPRLSAENQMKKRVAR